VILSFITLEINHPMPKQVVVQILSQLWRLKH